MKTFVCTLFVLFFSLLAAQFRPIVIENFDSGDIELISYPGEDIHPDAWELNSNNTYQNSQYSLKLYGNTWKILEIEPYAIDSTSVWQIASFIAQVGNISGFGVMDDENELLYSIAGEDMLDIEEWLTVYQGNFPNYQWNIVQLPIGSDWMAWHEYEPEITGLIFINDNDTASPLGVSYFDEILDITDALPAKPEVSISYSTSTPYRQGNSRFMDVQFTSHVYDPDCDDHEYFWEFGDGNTSNEPHPAHTYQIFDEHEYTVLLAVMDDTEQWGFASAQIQVPSGDSNLPLTMNFVGDVMLARGYEQPGGIIPTYGVEAIFEPTLHLLGEAADISVVNLESPLTTSTQQHPTKGICFKGHPVNVDGLVYAGFDVAMLANNHILDFMLPGLQETQQVLENAGIAHSGAGADSYEAYLPAFINKKGINVAFLSSSDRTGQYNNYQPYLNAGFNKPGFAYMTPHYVQQQIFSVSDVADLSVVMLHSGSEYSLGPISHYDLEGYPYVDEEYNPRLDVPKMWDRDIRHFIIDAGADLIVNHHPHIIQGLEVYNGKLIAHSLGNYIFDLRYPETMPSMVLQAEADENGFTTFSVDPVFIDNWIPQHATGQLGLHILDYLARRSKELDTYLHIDRENVKAHVIMDTLNMVYRDVEHEDELYFEDIADVKRSQPMRLDRTGYLSSVQSILPDAQYSYRLGRELIWFGNFEDEGCTLWDTSHPDAYYDDTVSYEGERSLCQQRSAYSGSVTTNLEQRIKKYEVVDYTLHGYIKTENANNVNIEIRYYTTRWGGYYIGYDTITMPISGTNDWTFFHKELDVPTNTGYFDIRLSSNGPSSGTGYTWFDNVGLIEWTDWQPLEYAGNITNPNDFYYIQIETAHDINDATITYRERMYDDGPPPVSTDDEIVSGVSQAHLYSNYPNPFNSNTTFSFSLHNPADVELELYNIKGQKVKTLFKDSAAGGKVIHVPWDGTNNRGQQVASGVYFYRLKVDDSVIETKKCLLLK